ncbi:MAG TPA: alpha/beta fold hydrolase [Herpetosiphonaceae bacterium]
MRPSTRRKLWRRGAALLLALGLLYAGLAVYKAIWYTTTPPQAFGSTSPADAGLAYEEISFASATGDGVTLRGWWIPNPASRRAIVIAHARYGNRAGYLKLLRPLWDAGYNLLLFDFRGHGQSDRDYCTWGIREQWDVVAAAEQARARGMERIGVFGESLGGASALMAQSKTDAIQAVASDSAYADAEPLLARNALKPGLILALLLVRGIDLDDVSPERAMAALGSRPALLIHGEADNAVPLDQARRLVAAGGPSAEAWFIPGLGHTQAMPALGDEYPRRLVAFFDAALGARPPR